MICPNCQREFAPVHWNQRLCSDLCRIESQRRVRDRYKRSDKGKLSEQRWIKSERRREHEKQYRQKPSAKRKAVVRARLYLERHPEAVIRKQARDRKYGRTRKGRRVNLKAVAKYRQTERGREQRRITKARRRGALGGFTPEEWNRRCAEFNNVCAICKKAKTLEIDHIVPISRGGDNNITNVQPLCRSCNSSKGAKLEDQVRLRL